MSFKYSVNPSAENFGDSAAYPDAEHQAMFKEVIDSYKSKFPEYDLSHMRLLMSPVPRTHDGDPKTTESDRLKYLGSWTRVDIIYINSDMKDAIHFYGIGDQVDQTTLQKQAMAHELAHEIFKYQMCEEKKAKMIKKAEDLKFDTPYLHHIDDDDPKEDLFCEYMAYRATGIWVKI